MEIPELNSNVHGQLIFDDGTKNTQGKKTASSINGARKLSICVQKFDPYFTLHMKTKSKWVKGLNIRLEIVRY
jgi:hypothetical protein